MLLEAAISTAMGLLGTCITSYVNYKDKKEDHKFQLEKMKLESQNMIEEVNANIRLAQVNSDIALEQLEAVAFQDSQKFQKQALPQGWVNILLEREGWTQIFTLPIALLLLLLMGIGDVLNHLMRPALTLYSLAIASWVTYQSWELVSQVGISVEIASNSWQDACNIVILLSVTMVTWWFGDRRVAKHLMHQKKGR